MVRGFLDSRERTSRALKFAAPSTIIFICWIWISGPSMDLDAKLDKTLQRLEASLQATPAKVCEEVGLF